MTAFLRTATFRIVADDMTHAEEIWDGDGPELGPAVEHFHTEDFVTEAEAAEQVIRDMQPVPERGPTDSLDPRLDCWFCPGVTSVALAPRHSGGDEDCPAHWVPVCQRHMEQWHNEIDAEERLPIIPRNGVALSVKQAGEVTALFDYLATTDRWDDDLQDVAEAIETGLRALAQEEM